LFQVVLHEISLYFKRLPSPVMAQATKKKASTFFSSTRLELYATTTHSRHEQHPFLPLLTGSLSTHLSKLQCEPAAWYSVRLVATILVYIRQELKHLRRRHGELCHRQFRSGPQQLYWFLIDTSRYLHRKVDGLLRKSHSSQLTSHFSGGTDCTPHHH
jgi:hypothetical protein